MTVYYNPQTDKLMIGERSFYPGFITLYSSYRNSKRIPLTIHAPERTWVEIGEF